MFNVASRARQWPSGRIPVRIDVEVAAMLARLVRPTLPLQASVATHRIALFAIMCVGAVLRFWGLGNVGLHGDEETMAMAMLGILRHGEPILPSGMFYPRGLSELYLMAASVSIFGESEWAFRLPSAVCGVLLIPLTYLAGRRYLRPTWNLALAACVATLPEFIIYAQTARMYGFLLAAIAACMACLNLWERDGKLRWLFLASIALLIGIELHALAITAVLLFLMPGLAKGDSRTLLHGLIAVVLLMLGFALINHWVEAQYPEPPADYAAGLGAMPGEREQTSHSFSLAMQAAFAIAALIVAFLAVRINRAIGTRPAAVGAVALMTAGVVAQFFLYYHLAALLIVTGIVVARRFGGKAVWSRVGLFIAGSGLIAVAHVALLKSSAGSMMKLVGLLVGQPSIWPYYKIMEFSKVAALLAVACLAWGVVKLAVGKRVPDYWVMMLLGVWIPMFMIGLFLWNVPSRYTAASILPLLIAAFAFVQHGADKLALRVDRRSQGWLHGTLALAVTALMVNPVAMAHIVNSGYEMNPDHKGAAEFMRQQNLQPDDVLIAEDVLQQTYYLGKVDYWLMTRNFARKFVVRVDGEIRDFYTGTAVVSDASMLEEILRAHPRDRIFVIGSGENQEDQRKSMRGDMDPVLNSDRFKPIFLGRDGFTRVWIANNAALKEDPSPGSRDVRR
jgi:4-amino-4-deoxy-L-arabinose transferase-like glycosyltransferase